MGAVIRCVAVLSYRNPAAAEFNTMIQNYIFDSKKWLCSTVPWQICHKCMQMRVPCTLLTTVSCSHQWFWGNPRLIKNQDRKAHKMTQPSVLTHLSVLCTRTCLEPCDNWLWTAGSHQLTILMWFWYSFTNGALNQPLDEDMSIHTASSSMWCCSTLKPTSQGPPNTPVSLSWVITPTMDTADASATLLFCQVWQL